MEELTSGAISENLNQTYGVSNFENEASTIPPASVENSASKKSARKKNVGNGNGGTAAIIPCKVCGDRASGVHYGIVTCEGCKGFFRRSLMVSKPYECNGNRNCTIDRASRNRCQYCRWKKCLELGMSRDSVKFGRMPRKQRENMESNGTIHQQSLDKEHLEISSYSAGPIAVPSEISNLTGLPLFYGGYPQPLQHGQIGTNTTGNTDMVDQISLDRMPNAITTSPMSSEYESSHASTPGPVQVPVLAPVAKKHSNGSQDDVTGSLTEAVLEAHLNTATYTREHRQQMKLIPFDYSTFWKYGQMTQLEWWIHCTTELTSVIYQIVEFAKLVPGFMALPQDDQIILLKGGAMEIAIIRMIELYDLNSHSIIFAGSYIPATLFQSTDPMEQKFIYDLFLFVPELASFGLTESEIALFSAMVLMWPHRTGLQNTADVSAMYQRFAGYLEFELRSSHSNGADQLFQRLLSMSGLLQNLSAQHLFILNQFMKSSPLITFPALYKEIFIGEQ